jgi:hypothetical protein
MTKTQNIKRDTYEKAKWLVKTVTGEEYGDGMTVTDIISGYAEPGYGPTDSVIVLGNWNPRTLDRDSAIYGTKANNLMPRLAEALENVGACIEWSDEWVSCNGCYRAVRTQGDSYSWQPYYAWQNECEIYCADCMIADGEDSLREYVNDSTKCVTWCEPSHVESFGYVKYAPGDPITYENGWHPGQTDDPSVILDAILEEMPDASVVFFLDENSQFYSRFSAYVKVDSEDSED